jgi:hypothetical protein
MGPLAALNLGISVVGQIGQLTGNDRLAETLNGLGGILGTINGSGIDFAKVLGGGSGGGTQSPGSASNSNWFSNLSQEEKTRIQQEFLRV